LLSVSSCIGSGLGIAGWSVLAQAFGWRASLFIDAAITALVAGAVLFMVPADEPFLGRAISLRGFRGMLADRDVQALSMCFFGTGVTGVLTGSFTVYYLEKVFDLQPGYAGSVSGIAYLGPIFTTVFAGRLYDRGTTGRRILFGSALALGLGTALLAVHSIYVVLFGVILCGLAGPPIGTIAFAAAKKLAPSPDLEAMTIGLVDTFALSGVFVGAFVFPFMVLGLGYPVAWMIGGVVGVLATAPVLLREL